MLYSLHYIYKDAMNKFNKVVVLFACFLFVFNLISFDVLSQNGKNETKKTLKVGDQVWMCENLEVDKFQNGDPILKAKSMDEWRAADKKNIPAWCYPDFKDTNAHLGKLYNYFAVNDIRNLAPKGWTIPTDFDWDKLVSYLGNEITGGKKLSSVAVIINGIVSDKMGSFFNKRPGSMNLDGSWGVGKSNSWWSSSKFYETNWVRYISSEGPMSRRSPGPWGEGFAIRCIRKDLSISEPFIENEKFEDIKTDFQSIQIDNQIWSDKNLSVKHFQNGDTIHFVNNSDDWLAANEAKVPAWCYMDDRPINGNNYGLMYNWYAVNDPRGLAPKGWHIPTVDEWKNLINNLGGDTLAGPKLKSKTAWYDKSNNSSNLNILPAGGRNFYGVFHLGIGGSVVYWTSSVFNNNKAYCVYLGDEKKVFNGETEKSHGYYIRIVKD